MADDLPVAGWYEDPSDDGAYRYWNGHRWTHHRRRRESQQVRANDPVEPPPAAPASAKPAPERSSSPTRPAASVKPARVGTRRVAVVAAAVVAAIAAVGIVVTVRGDGSGGGDEPRDPLSGSGLATCASVGGRSRCWGEAEDPPQRPEIDNAAQVSVVADHGCAVREDGDVVCWGQNDNGQLGVDGGDRKSPSKVKDLPPAKRVAVADGFSCAVTRVGEVWCWGSNLSGQLGLATLSDANFAAQPVPGVARAVDVVAAAGHACARAEDGEAMCWGRANRGQLGTGTVADVAAPAPVQGLEGIEQLVIGDWSGCAIAAEGELWCWGDDTFGQSSGASRSSAPRSTPNRITLHGRVRAVVVGTFHTCALVGEVDVRCWGAEGAGQLGRGRGLGSAEPVKVEL